MKVAFDLDGVLVPDCDHIPRIASLDEFYTLTEYMRPIFSPKGEYAILTARPAEYRSITWTWCNKYLNPLPVRLFHERTDEGSAGQYKANILNTNPSIELYVESDPGIVSYLKKNVNTGCEIVHFADYLEQKLMRV